MYNTFSKSVDDEHLETEMQQQQQHSCEEERYCEMERNACKYEGGPFTRVGNVFFAGQPELQTLQADKVKIVESSSKSAGGGESYNTGIVMYNPTTVEVSKSRTESEGSINASYKSSDASLKNHFMIGAGGRSGKGSSSTTGGGSKKSVKVKSGNKKNNSKKKRVTSTKPSSQKKKKKNKKNTNAQKKKNKSKKNKSKSKSSGKGGKTSKTKTSSCKKQKSTGKKK